MIAAIVLLLIVCLVLWWTVSRLVRVIETQHKAIDILEVVNEGLTDELNGSSKGNPNDDGASSSTALDGQAV